VKYILLSALCALSVTQPALAQSVSSASPGAEAILNENQHVRTYRFTYAPGVKVETPSFHAGWYYVTKGGTIKVTWSDGKTEMWTPKAGESGWIDDEAAHMNENVGSARVEFVWVEIKSAKACK
jgi:hypothetical protein